MSEWFAKDKDLKATLEEYLLVIGKKRLENIFFSTTRTHYKKVKYELTHAVAKFDNSRRSKINFNKSIELYFRQAEDFARRASSILEPKPQAEFLGAAFGFFMAAVDYGITSPAFDGSSRVSIILSAHGIRTNLDQINQSIISI